MGKSKDLATGETRFVNTAGDTMTGTLVAGTRLQVGDSSITQAYTQSNFGYVADFQASSGTQTYISIAAPQASSLGDTGVVIGEDASDTYITQRGNKNIKLATQDTVRLAIDGSGRVTKPSQPSFAAYTATGNNAANITFGNTFFNIGSHFVASTGIFTAPVAGRYLFTWHALHTQSPTSYARVLFKINGSTDTQFGDSLTSDGNGIYVNTALSGIINLSANDTVRLYNEGNTIYGSQYAMFSGCLLG